MSDFGADRALAASPSSRQGVSPLPGFDHGYEAACKAVCRSGKFETGQGTCAAICMEFLGNPRKSGCAHAVRVHGALVSAVLDATQSTGETA